MNGWSNTETWEAYTLMSNTEWQYIEVMNILKECKAKYPKGAVVTLFAGKLIDRFGEQDGVDWDEIADAFMEGQA